MSNYNSLSVVIPAYNEARRLPKTLERVAHYAKGAFPAHEIIVVDDGSSDATAAIASEFARKRDIKNVRVLRAPKNLGKGAALRRGVMASQGEFVLLTDADLSTPIGEMDKLLRPIRAGADVAIGSRHTDGSVVTKRPWYREVLSRASGLFIRTVLELPFYDTQCGFKLFRREAAVALFRNLSLPRFSYDFEILSRAQQTGMRVAEVGVVWEHREFTTVRLRDAQRDVYGQEGDVKEDSAQEHCLKEPVAPRAQLRRSRLQRVSNVSVNCFRYRPDFFSDFHAIYSKAPYRIDGKYQQLVQ